MAGDHDHAKLDLFLGRKFVAVRLVIFFDFRGRNDHVSLHVLAPHRLHDHSLGLQFFEFAQRVILGFERFDKSIAVATE